MRTLPLLAATALLALLAACGPDSPGVPLPPDPTDAPAFASDAEALAAAEEAYAAYLAISGEISDDGGREPERIAEYTSDSYSVRAIESFTAYSDNGLHTTGTTTADTFDLIYFDAVEVQVGLCVDVTKSRVLDEVGVDVTPTNRPERVGLIVLFQIIDGRLLVADSDITGEKQC